MLKTTVFFPPEVCKQRNNNTTRIDVPHPAELALRLNGRYICARALFISHLNWQISYYPRASITVDNMSKRVTKLILPFAVPAEDRATTFTKDMEMAAVFYLAESDREKGERRILKKPAERLVFVAEACYPIWLFPWRGKTLLFDGLGVARHTLYYEIPPDIKAFDNDIQASSKTREAYSVVLSQNASYFENFDGKEEKTIESLISDRDFIQDFVAYLSELEEIEKPVTTKAIISPTIDESEISASIDELSNLRARLKEDIKSLGESMKLLSMQTREQAKTLREEIKEIQKKFDQKIEEVKPRTTQKMQQIQERYDEEITRISTKFQRQLRSLHKDRVKLEKTQERLTAEIDRCEAGKKSCRLRKDEGGEIHWSQKLEKIKKKLPALQKNIEYIDRNIEDVETAKKLEISKQQTKRETRIEEAMKVLRELEASREARIRMKQQEVTWLKDTTFSIINQMNEMFASKKAALSELDKIGTPGRRDLELAYLPLYFVCYETELKKRYVVYPPSIVNSMGVLTKLKGVFGATKMKSFLQPRSKAITAFLNQLVVLTDENPVFEKEVSDAGIEANILRTTELRIGIKRGLGELREEKWISESELRAFSKLV